MAGPARKPDARGIRAFIDDLASQEWLAGSRRSWWPRFLFHHTDIRNAARILQDNQLLCRRALGTRGGPHVDSGSVDVLQNTPDWVADWVRLYFRPRTPTQYRSEGVRPADQIRLQAHCPVPVFFLFDSAEVLTLAAASFSDGNLAADASTGTDVEFLRALDFRKIYHTGWHDHDREITFSRNAEVIVKSNLGLGGLRRMVTRTDAERETLLSLLTATAQKTWLGKIVVDTGLQLFERSWTFIEQVELDSDLATIRFSPDTQGPGPFVLHIDVTDLGDGSSYVYDDPEFSSRPPIFQLSIPNELTSYRLTVTLDSHLVYQADYFDDPPF